MKTVKCSNEALYLVNVSGCALLNIVWETMSIPVALIYFMDDKHLSETS